MPTRRSHAHLSDLERPAEGLFGGMPFDDDADGALGPTGPAHEIVLFQVGTHVFAAPVRDVLRIGALRDLPAEDVVLESPLGVPFTQQRGIVVGAGASERALAVDQVIGFRTVADADLQPLPAFAAACIHSAALSGLVVLDDMPMPVIDLPTLLREHAARPAGTGAAAP